MTGKTWQEKRFVESAADMFLKQHVEFTTRKSNILDLVLADDGGMIQNVRRIGKLGTSDHDAVEFDVGCGCDDVGPPPTVQMVPNFSRADFHTIRQELSGRDWQHDFLFMNQ